MAWSSEGCQNFPFPDQQQYSRSARTIQEAGKAHRRAAAQAEQPRVLHVPSSARHSAWHVLSKEPAGRRGEAGAPARRAHRRSIRPPRSALRLGSRSGIRPFQKVLSMLLPNLYCIQDFRMCNRVSGGLEALDLQHWDGAGPKGEHGAATGINWNCCQLCALEDRG